MNTVNVKEPKQKIKENKKFPGVKEKNFLLTRLNGWKAMKKVLLKWKYADSEIRKTKRNEEKRK